MESPLYRHNACFIPRGMDIRNTSEVKNIQFESDSRQREHVRNLAEQTIVKTGKIDQYALRNHWELFELEITYNCPPWDSECQLISDIASLPSVEQCSVTDTVCYVRPKPGMRSQTAADIVSYYPAFTVHATEYESLAVASDPGYVE